VTNCWDTLLKRGNFWEQNNPHPLPQGWVVATLFSTGRGWRRESVNFPFEASKRQEGPLAVFRANCLNLSLRAVVLLKITPSSTGYTYSVASDNCLRLCPHTDGSYAGKRSLSDGAYVYTWERYFDLEKRSSPAYRIGFYATLWRMVFNWPHAHWSGKSGDKV